MTLTEQEIREIADSNKTSVIDALAREGADSRIEAGKSADFYAGVIECVLAVTEYAIMADDDRLVLICRGLSGSAARRYVAALDAEPEFPSEIPL